MAKENQPIRYSVISEKNPREIVMLKGSGCRWRRCRFCDYHLDFSRDEAANFKLNRRELAKVTGQFERLEVINSGSFTDLDLKTLEVIEQTCLNRNISQLHFETHWMHRKEIGQWKKHFAAVGITLKIKMGVETFDPVFREQILDKGMGEAGPGQISQYADEVCLLFGLAGQTAASMKKDVQTGLDYFERVCVNIMVENSTPVKPDRDVIDEFKRYIYPLYIEDPRVDILLDNTDFGVGGEADE